MNTTATVSASPVAAGFTPKKVRIVPNSKTNALVTLSKNPKFGFVQLEETEESFEMGWMRTIKKSTLVRADVESLNKLIQDNRTLALPGKIVVQEFAEGNVPANIEKAFLSGKNMDPEEQRQQYLKRAGAEGPVLMSGDQRILRFTWYDKTGLTPDVKCDHDNAVEAPVRTMASGAAAFNPAPAATAPAAPAVAEVAAPEAVAEDAALPVA